MKPHRRERAQSLTEFAISFTFIMFLMAGAVDLGRAFYAYVAIRDAAQEGASYASICPLDLAGIEEHVRDNSTDPIGLSDTSGVHVAIEYIEGTTSPGDGIKVAVTYDFETTMPLLGTIVPDRQLPLTATMIDTILRQDGLECP